jgi:hypothetical protein
VNTICFNQREIKKVKLYFEGIDYRYIGIYGPFNEGIAPDWELFD